MVSTETGQQIGAAAAQFLERYGFSIRERNWRTRWCEVDIIAERARHIYFIEVTYRSPADFGSGFDYMTQRQLRHMHCAAEFWLASQPYTATYHISALELSGNPPQVLEWLPDV